MDFHKLLSQPNFDTFKPILNVLTTSFCWLNHDECASVFLESWDNAYMCICVKFYYWALCYANLRIQQNCISCTSKGRQNENLITCYIGFQELAKKEGPLVYSTIAYGWTIDNTPEVWWNPVTVAYFVRTSTHHSNVDIGYS